MVYSQKFFLQFRCNFGYIVWICYQKFIFFGEEGWKLQKKIPNDALRRCRLILRQYTSTICEKQQKWRNFFGSHNMVYYISYYKYKIKLSRVMYQIKIFFSPWQQFLHLAIAKTLFVIWDVTGHIMTPKMIPTFLLFFHKWYSRYFSDLWWYFYLYKMH